MHTISEVTVKIHSMLTKSKQIEIAINEGNNPDEIKFLIDELKQLATEISNTIIDSSKDG
jgi:hypothetical protein